MRGALVLMVCVACSGGSNAAPTDAGNPDSTVDGGIPATQIGFDLWHVMPIQAVGRTSTAAFSLDQGAHWVLWDLTTHGALASGDLACGAQNHSCAFDLGIAGSILVDRVFAGLEVRSTSSGAVIATIATTAPNAGLARDGSYLWTATSNALQVWSPAGAMVASIAGDYAHAIVYAAPGELRAAQESTIETIQIATLAKTTVAFGGTFGSWFDDGEHFTTTIGTTVRVYTKAGTQVSIGSLPTVEQLTGQGAYLWTYQASTPGYPLRIYAIADLSAPAATFNLEVEDTVAPAGTAIAHLPAGAEHISFISLDSVIAESAPIPVPMAELTAFSGDPDHWIAGARLGVVHDGVAPLSYGVPFSISGTENGIAAIGTVSGRIPILHLDATSATIEREIPLRSSQLELSVDGTTLITTDDLEDAQYHEDRSLRVVSVADGTVTYRWPYAWSQYPTVFQGFTFARTGLVLAHRLEAFDVATNQPRSQNIYTDLHGNTLPYYGPTTANGFVPLPDFSPDGTHAAFTFGRESIGIGIAQSNQTVQFYSNGVLVGAADGVLLAWLDNDRALVATYPVLGPQQSSEQGTVTIYDPTGVRIADAMLPDVGGQLLIPISGGLVYARPNGVSTNRNAIYSYETGATIWKGDFEATMGTPVGDSILYVKGPHLFRSAFR